MTSERGIVSLNVRVYRLKSLTALVVKIEYGVIEVKEDIMKVRFTELGSIKNVTRDYSGAWAWDGIVYDFRKYWPWG